MGGRGKHPRWLRATTGRDHKAGMPSRRVTAVWSVDRFGSQAAAGDQPGGQRIGVPHFAGTEFVASPDRRRDLRNQVEYSPREVCVVGESVETVDGFSHVGDDAAWPAAPFVAEDPEPPGPAAPTAPSATTPRVVPSLSRIAISITKDPSATRAMSAEW